MGDGRDGKYSVFRLGECSVKEAEKGGGSVSDQKPHGDR